jgi:hypothetical protein
MSGAVEFKSENASGDFDMRPFFLSANKNYRNKKRFSTRTETTAIIIFEKIREFRLTPVLNGKKISRR